MDFEVVEAVEPDIEVVVRAGEQELAVIGLFQNKSDVWDLLIGVDDVERVEQIRSLFTAILAALPLASFSEVRTAGGVQFSFVDTETTSGGEVGKTNVNQDH